MLALSFPIVEITRMMVKIEEAVEREMSVTL
jgi:hypothetical protein